MICFEYTNVWCWCYLDKFIPGLEGSKTVDHFLAIPPMVTNRMAALEGEKDKQTKRYWNEEKREMRVKISDGTTNLTNIHAGKLSVRAVVMRPIESDRETWTQKDLVFRLRVQCCFLLFQVGPSGVAWSAPFLLLTTIWTQQLTCQYQTQPLCTFSLNKPLSFRPICLCCCDFVRKLNALQWWLPALRWTEVHRTYKDIWLL